MVSSLFRYLRLWLDQQCTSDVIQLPQLMLSKIRAATAGKAPKAWALPRFWVSICSYKKQPVKKIWVRILDLAWVKFAVAALMYMCCLKINSLI